MKRRFNLYLGIAVIALRGRARKIVRAVGEWMKMLGRRLVLWGEDSTLRFSTELFCGCYLADVELHIGMHVYRGPMYTAYISGDKLFFKLNWVARQTALSWKEEGGSCDFKLSGFGSPHKLDNGDVWFMFDDGYVILFLGTPRERLDFKGADETPRIYTYF